MGLLVDVRFNEMVIANHQKNRVENVVAEYWIQDGILHGRFKSGALIDLEAAKDCLKIRNQILGDQTLPLLLDVRGLKELTKSARDFLGSPQCMKGTSAGVLLTNNSIFVRTVANIFFRLATPAIPHRMYSDLATAEKWLSSYKA